VIPVAIAVLLAQPPGCSGKGASLAAAARTHADNLELTAAAESFDAAVSAGCVSAQLPAIYVRALIAARDAYRLGGSAESLEPVKRALDRIDSMTPLPPEGDVVRFVLRAAMAAAQSERDELALLIDHAVDLEATQHAAGLGAAPIVTAHEAAGDLWLQVYRDDDARRAYVRAAERIGLTRRVRLGLARTAVRMSDTPTACEQYRMLLSSWPSARQDVPEVSEARAFLQTPPCRSSQKTR